MHEPLTWALAIAWLDVVIFGPHFAISFGSMKVSRQPQLVVKL